MVSPFRAPQSISANCAAGRTAWSENWSEELAALAKQRKVVVLQGLGTFVSPHALKVVDGGGSEIPVSFDTAIIAAGSEPVPLAGMPLGDTRIIDSTGALEITDVPKRLLIIGAGIIGLEMATVYHALGSAVTVVELMDQIIPEADRDIVVPLLKRIEKRYENIYLKTKVVKVEASSRNSSFTSRGAGRQQPTPSTRSSSPSAASPTDIRSALTPRVSLLTSRASSPSTARCAPMSPTSSPLAISSAGQCSPTRPRTRPRSRPRSLLD